MALFIINGVTAQGSFHALLQKTMAQIKHPTSKLNEDVQDGMHKTGMKTSTLNADMISGKINTPQTHKPQDLIQIFDSVYEWQWDTVSVGWTIAYKTLNIVYDVKYNMTSYTGQSWDGIAWENSSKCTSTYDANNNETSFRYETWNGTTWENYSKNNYTYDANNNLTNSLLEW